MKKPFLMLLLLFSLLANAQENWAPTPGITISRILYNPITTPYNYEVANAVYDEIEPVANYQLGISLPLNERFSLGLSYRKHWVIRDITYYESTLEGDSVYDDWYSLYKHYSNSDIQIRAYNHYFGAHATYKILSKSHFSFTGDAGIHFLFTSFRENTFHRYGVYYYGDWDDNFIEVKKILPGVSLSLEATYLPAKDLGLFVRTTGLWGGKTINSKSLAYFSADAGVRFSFYKDTAAYSRRHTLMAGIGLPFSLSYERIMLHRKLIHSARIFVNNYIFYETVPGIAYNIRVGKNKHFLLGELFAVFTENMHTGGAFGYVFSGKNGLFLRADYGYMYNDDSWLLNLQFHAGYSF
ncbi:MAG: hypothetical protein EOL88_08215 [Bacteroidia bacterium]|nr:hypothetical protein [Bacteroidales bacterium]MDY0286115.1 hypothetical protein [Bacteroidales bacterium]NCD42061.1 hypothetical protein [Bacteroidia bacterium]